MHNRRIQKSLLRAAALGLFLWGMGAFPENGWATSRTPTPLPITFQPRTSDSNGSVATKTDGSVATKTDENSQKRGQDSHWQRTKQGALKNLQKIAPTKGMKDGLEQKRRALSAKRHGDDGAHYDAKRAMEASKKNKETSIVGSGQTRTGSPKDYLTLGLEAGASKDNINKAYKKLARQYHPDKNPNNPDAAEKMQEITAAYNRLKNVQ